LLEDPRRRAAILLAAGLLAWLQPVRALFAEELVIRASSNPAELDLAEQASASLEIRVQTPAGAPVSGVPIEVQARRGSVVDLHELGNGRYGATYRPPVERYPQVEILVFRVQGQALSWLSLPLNGAGELEVQTDPNASALLELNGRSFGPVQADPAGKARIPFRAPPGIEEGTLVTFKDQSIPVRKPIQLGVPHPVPFLVVSGSGKVVADGRSAVPIEMFVLDRNSQPLTAGRLSLQADAGQVSAVEERSPGWYVARFIAPGEVGSGVATVTFSAEGLGEGYRAVVQIQLIPKPSAIAPASESRWAWLPLGAGAAMVIPGVVLLALDGRETCDGPAAVRCPKVYDTVIPGGILVGLGAALLATSVVIFLLPESGNGVPAASVSVQAGPAGAMVLVRGSLPF
jgi:hypothetical protein